jgi:hypothetical protein
MGLGESRSGLKPDLPGVCHGSLCGQLVINQSAPVRISSHVYDLISKILRIADAMLVETRLPYLPV